MAEPPFGVALDLLEEVTGALDDNEFLSMISGITVGLRAPLSDAALRSKLLLLGGGSVCTSQGVKPRRREQIRGAGRPPCGAIIPSCAGAII